MTAKPLEVNNVVLVHGFPAATCAVCEVVQAAFLPSSDRSGVNPPSTDCIRPATNGTNDTGRDDSGAAGAGRPERWRKRLGLRRAGLHAV